jgi:hypothetical protein
MRKALWLRTLPLLVFAFAALDASFGQDEPVQLSDSPQAGQSLVYRLDEVRTDRAGSLSRTTSAQSIFSLALPNEPGATPVLTIERHRVDKEATPIEGSSAPVKPSDFASGGIASFIAPYFPALRKGLNPGDSCTAPFFPPSLGRVHIPGDPPTVEYTLLQLVPSRSGAVAEIAATADFAVDNATLYGSALGLRRPRSTAVRIDPETPAYEAGLRTGDRITKVDGKRVVTWEEAASIQSTGKLIVEIHPPLREKVGGKAVKRPSRYTFDIPEGFGVETVGVFPLGLRAGDSGEVIVGTVEKGSAAAKAGISPGDMITRLGPVKVESWADYEYLLARVPPETRLKVERLPLGESEPVVASAVTQPRELYRFAAKGTFAGSFRIDADSGELLEASWECEGLIITISIGGDTFDVETTIKSTLSLVERRPR